MVSTSAVIGYCERCGELHELEWIHSVNKQLCADCTLHLILNGGLDEPRAATETSTLEQEGNACGR